MKKFIYSIFYAVFLVLFTSFSAQSQKTEINVSKKINLDTKSTTAIIIDDYDATDYRVYLTDGVGVSSWDRNVVSEQYEAYTNALATPEHSFASYDLTNSIAGWDLNKGSSNSWCGWMDLNRTSVSGWGSLNYSCAMVLAANNADFNNTGVQGYALGFDSNDNLVLFKFSDGIHDGATLLPGGSTQVVDCGYDYLDGDNGVNFYVEYLADGTWKVSYLIGAPLTAAQAVDLANYTDGSATSAADETYSGTTYKYAGWAYAHSSGASEKAFFDNFGAGAQSCTKPDVDASVVNFTSITEASATVNWTSGNGASRIVVAKMGSPVDWVPTDANTYTANSAFGSGTELGTGNYVVYNGSGSTFDMTNLTGATEYYIKVFEYSCSAGNEAYYTAGTPAEGNFTTLIAPVTNLQVICRTNTTATVSWDIPSGNYTGVIIGFRNDANPCHVLSVDASTLTADAVFASGTEYGSTTPYSYVVYKGTGTSVTVTGLTQGQQYQIKAYTYLDETGTSWGATTPTTNISSLEVEDVSEQKALAGNNSVTLSWINPTGCYDEIMLVAKYNGSVTGSPSGDGSAYTANSVYASGTLFETDAYVVYKGVGTDITVTNLINNENYCFKIFTRVGEDWSPGVEVCKVPMDITYFAAGELIYVGYDTKTSGYDCNDSDVAIDAYYILTMVDIKPGTEFGLLNASFEYGAAANERTNKFWSCTSTPGTNEPGRVSIAWNGASTISSGSIIAVFVTAVGSANHFEINGVDETANFSSAGSYTNISESAPDQMWLYQGIITDHDVSPNIYSTVDGIVIFGLSNQAAWVPFTSPVTDVRTSRNHPDIECFNMDFSGDIPVNYYLTTALHTGTKRNILLSLMDPLNWQTEVNTDCNDIPAGVASATFSIVAGDSDGTWVGDQDTDWFNCGNWQSLAVPETGVNVTIPSTASRAVDIDNTSANAEKFSFKAECNDLTIDGNTVTVTGDVGDTLIIGGNLTIQNSGVLDMDDGTATQDGIVYIEGDWTNNATFNKGDGTVVFNGTESQAISNSSGTETFNYLTLNNLYVNGITLNSNLIIADTFTNNSLLNLNAKNIEIQADYLCNDGFFDGNSSSSFSITGTGALGVICFDTNYDLLDFTINRAGVNANLMTNLYVANNFTITAGSVTLKAACNFNAGTLVNTPGTADALIIKSDATGTASLIQSAGDVPATCERYTSANVWHYVFTPLSSVDTTVFTQTSLGLYNKNFYFYNEPNFDYWDDLTLYGTTGWQDETNQFISTDKGYAHSAPENRVYVLTGGNILSGQKIFTLSYTDSGTGPVNQDGVTADWDDFEGWNFIGNPYTSAIDWDNAGIDKTNVENVIYYYDGNTSNYKYYGGGTVYNQGISVNGGSRYVPQNQGFYVKAINSGNFTIPNTARVHSSQAFWKQSSQTGVLRFNIAKDNFIDESVIRNVSDATDSHDFAYDAYKMVSLDKTKVQIYSKNIQESEYYAINSLSVDTENKEVPIGIYAPVYGEYEINFTENTFENTHIYLEDLYLDKKINLLNQNAYTFNYQLDNLKDRFVVCFNPNNVPVLNVQIPDQITYTNTFYSYTLPENMFLDSDFEDSLQISISVNSESGMPQNFNFDTESMTITSYPINVDNVIIGVSASDIFGAKVYDEYILEIKEQTTNIYDILPSQISIYPNPAKNKFTLDIGTQKNNTKIVIYDASGRKISSRIIFERISDIDISKLNSGVYFLEIIFNDKIFREKLIKQ